MKENKKAVIILSGGMDSTTLLYDIINQGYDVYALSFNYNQKHNKELNCSAKTCEKLNIFHKVINLGVLNEIAPSALTRTDWEIPEGHYEEDNMKETVVANRNMVMIALAASFASTRKAKHLFYGAHAGDHAIYPDCRKEFVEAMKESIKLCDWSELELHAPYLNVDKGDIVIKGKELNVDYSLTTTCYNGREKACGKCGSCQERLEAFKKLGIEDPVEYE